jgi:hypothetical protein
MFLRGLAAAAVVLSNCGSYNDTASITSMNFLPTDVSPGVATELTVNYNLMQPITGGTATYSYSFNGIPFSPTIDDLCTQTACPKDIGTLTEVSKSTFPAVSGKIVSSIQWTDQENRNVWCVKLTFRV